MPAVDDWIGSPLNIIRNLFEQTESSNSDNHVNQVKQYFTSRVSTEDAVKWIPSLNDVALHTLKSNSLARYRCMVQDMFDPEYYLGIYEVEDVKQGKKVMHSGMWKDIAECGPHQEILYDSTNNKTMDRQTLYCVPVPGENVWVKQAYACTSCSTTEAPSTSTNQRQKRPLEDDSGINTDLSNTTNDCGVSHNGKQATGEGNQQNNEETMETEEESGSTSKKTKTESKTKSEMSSAVDLNFPLPGEKGPACLVKLYDTIEAFKVNDMVEFIGVLSNDPAMAEFPEEKKNDQSGLIDPADMEICRAEHEAHHPPPSLVPRLHVILATKLRHSNPLIPKTIDSETPQMEDIQKLLSEATEIRQCLLNLLQESLFGDVLTAEYILCHLVSTVYARHDVIALGKFAVNMSGCPRDSKFASHFYKLLENLVAKSHLLPLTIQNLNNLKYTPRKDYSVNRLSTGILQLSEHTHLVLDETSMQPGQLDANGVRNLTALGNAIQWQKAEYDFNFHKQDFPMNINVLVLSEGRSLMKCDCQIALSPKTPVEDIEGHFNRIQQNLSAEMLNKTRAYLGLMQLLPYNLEESVQKEVENDFVDVRKENPESMTVDDFHALLVLARLVSLSHGKTSLTKEMWDKTKQLEYQRKQRMQTTAQSA